MNHQKTWLNLMFICFLFLFVGCSEGKEEVKEAEGKVTNQADNEVDEIDEKTNEENEDENDHLSISNNLEKVQYESVEERMQLNMEDAPYSGDKYDEDTVLKELEQLPDNLTNEEYFKGMLSLIGEDYREYYDFFEGFDTSTVEITAEPGSKDAPNTSDEEKVEKQVNVSILLDSSGSMNEQIDGKTKMQIAKEAIEKFVEGLPKEANVSLTVYGHVGSGSDSDKKLSCTTIEEVYPLDHFEKGKFQKALKSFDPVGWTPLGGALKTTQKSLEKQTKKDEKNIIYVVSDGVETCDTNPVEAAKNINQSNIEAIVNIIGFDVDDEGQKQLKKVAEAGKGEYSTARSKQELNQVFEENSIAIINEWYQWSAVNLNKSHDSETNRRNELSTNGTEMINLSYGEQQRITQLSYDLQQSKGIDLRDVRAMAQEIGVELRAYANDKRSNLNNEIMEKSRDQREGILNKSKKEREQLRDK